jgi:uncharacterized peroxidase-related enzyme
MKQFAVPTREQVSENNRIMFDKLNAAIGMVPNLYAVIAYSDTGLENYLTLQNSKTSLSKKEKEAINLVVSEINHCRYCQAAHTVLGKMNGFSEEQTLEIRSGSASFDPKLHALIRFTKEATINKGKVSDAALNGFFNAGYTKGSIVDVILAIADKVVMNYLHNLTQIPIDFPLAKQLKTETEMV